MSGISEKSTIVFLSQFYVENILQRLIHRARANLVKLGWVFLVGYSLLKNTSLILISGIFQIHLEFCTIR